MITEISAHSASLLQTLFFAILMDIDHRCHVTAALKMLSLYDSIHSMICSHKTTTENVFGT